MSKNAVINLKDVPLRENGNGGSFEAQLGRIGTAIGAQKLGCMLHVVKPGKKAIPFHAHHVNEEMYLILEGSGTMRLGDKKIQINNGDIIAAPSGDDTSAHQLSNTGETDLHYLCFSTRHDPDVVEYPDSNKFAVGSMVPKDKGLLSARIAYIGRTNNSLDYFDGEET